MRSFRNRKRNKWLTAWYRLRYRVLNLPRTFQYHFVPYHQYHLIRTGLKPNYYDIDTIMLHGMMALIVRYVDDEHGGLDKLEDRVREFREADPLDWCHGMAEKDPSTWSPEEQLWVHDSEESLTRQMNKEQEAVDIYLWWKVERPAAWTAYENLKTEHYSHVTFDWEPTKLPDYGDETFYEMKVTEEPGSPTTSRSLYETERDLDAKDQEMLHRLIDLRQFLWT